MIIRILFACLSLFFRKGIRLGKIYDQHIQMCSGSRGFDIKWKLTLNENNTYLFQLTEKSNNYLDKEKRSFLSGTWQITNDTLRLNILDRISSPLLFIINGNRLTLSQKNSLRPSKFVQNLDFLKSVNSP